MATVEFTGIRTDRAAVTAVVLGVTAFAFAQGLTYPADHFGLAAARGDGRS